MARTEIIRRPARSAPFAAAERGGIEVTKQWIALLAAVCCQSAVVAQEPMGPPKPAASGPAAASPLTAGPGETMEEVEIIGSRAQLRELRAEIVRLEDKFYKLYNELNTKDEYDVHCNLEKPTGTLLSYRVCKPEFVENATSEEAKGFLGGYTVAPANLVIMAKYPEFEREALSVINRNRDLRVIIRDRDMVERRYENLRQQEFGQPAPKASPSAEAPKASPGSAAPKDAPKVGSAGSAELPKDKPKN
jgi:hypothetical protein